MTKEDPGKNGSDPAKACSNGENSEVKVPPTTVAIMSNLTGACLPDSQKSVVLNVGGQRYESLKRNFANFPNSRLYRLVHSTNPEEILRYCDRFKPGYENGCANDYVPAEYFFDRNWTGFAAILVNLKYQNFWGFQNFKLFGLD